MMKNQAATGRISWLFQELMINYGCNLTKLRTRKWPLGLPSTRTFIPDFEEKKALQEATGPSEFSLSYFIPHYETFQQQIRHLPQVGHPVGAGAGGHGIDGPAQIRLC